VPVLPEIVDWSRDRPLWQQDALRRLAEQPRLTRVHSVRNVNALRDDQSLVVARTGLTVVYVDNGAGKSGYVRMLKRVCRAGVPSVWLEGRRTPHRVR
jgi:hypothetical protein